MSNYRGLHGWIAAAAASFFVLVHLVLLLLSSGPEARVLVTDLLTPVVDLLATGAIVIAGLRQWSVDRRTAAAWLVIGAAQLMTTIGDTLWCVYEVFLGQSPSPSLADAFYLLYYPLFLGGVLILPVFREKLSDWLKTSIDMVIVLLAAVLVFWNYLIGPLYLAGAENNLLLFISLAYPVGDLLLLWAVLVIFYRSADGLKSRPLWYLAAGTVMLIVFDSLYVYMVAQDLYQSGSLIDVSFTFGNALFGMAGVLKWSVPAKADQAEGGLALVTGSQTLAKLEVDAHPTRWWWMHMPYLWVGGAYAMLISSTAVPLPMSVVEISLWIGAISSLVIIRQIITLHDNRSLHDRLQRALNQVRSQAVMLEKTNHSMQIEIQERRRMEGRLVYDALHDALTGLPNRSLFLDRLAQAARKQKRFPTYEYAVLFLDLDSFKLVNDSLGHTIGDQLLVRAGQILLNCVRATDTVARLGGDEFVILLDDISSSEDAVRTAERMQSELGAPLQLDGARVFVSVSIGIVHNPRGYEYPEDVLRDADLAMYQAKLHGKARHEIFQPSMRASVILRMSLESDLRHALENDEFVLHYQPILALPSQRLVGFEALVRWQHPTRGLVGPMEFIPVAEETGLILPLGKWILRAACRQAREWMVRYPEMMPFKVGVNISGKQIKQPDFVATVAGILEETGLPPTCLALEVTESVCIESLDSVAGTLLALQGLGIETQIDDFGTGYSSLSYLRRLPVQSIKIDRSFVQSINDNSASSPDLIRAIFSMVNNLGIKAVAEGIENETQLAELRSLNCAYVQGFLLASPMDTNRLALWMGGK